MPLGAIQYVDFILLRILGRTEPLRGFVHGRTLFDPPTCIQLFKF